jgi:hypothetical protein
MSSNPEVPGVADPEQLEKSGEAIEEAKAAAGRAARDDSIDRADLPTTGENVPGAPTGDTSDAPEQENAGAAEDEDR